MKLVSLNSGILINNTIGDNKSYNSYAMPGELVILTDDDADSMISSCAVNLIGEITETPGLSVVHPHMPISVDAIPRVVSEYNMGKCIISTPEFSEVCKAFGVEVKTFYPIEMPYIDIYTDAVKVPNMELISDNNALWSDVEVVGKSNVVEHIKGMNCTKAMFWITKSPKVHPDTVLSISNALSNIYDTVFICGRTDIELDLYRGLCYNDNVIDFIGRLGLWSSVVRFADTCDFIISPSNWIAQLMSRLGKNVQVIGPCGISGISGVGGNCIEDNMYCQNCSVEFCPGISCINVDTDGDNIVLTAEVY